MKFNNEQVIFDIPSLSNEWVSTCILCYDELTNYFLLKNEKENVKGTFVCRLNIFHTISGDIDKLDVVCLDFTSNDFIFKWIVEPIFKKYCTENKVDLKFNIYYE